MLDTSIEQQYLNSQPAVYWHLFLRGIEALLPHYRPHLLWFRRYNVVSYETTYIMRRKYFMRYAREFFAIRGFWENASCRFSSMRTGCARSKCRWCSLRSDCRCVFT